MVHNNHDKPATPARPNPKVASGGRNNLSDEAEEVLLKAGIETRYKEHVDTQKNATTRAGQDADSP